MDRVYRVGRHRRGKIPGRGADHFRQSVAEEPRLRPIQPQQPGIPGQSSGRHNIRGGQCQVQGDPGVEYPGQYFFEQADTHPRLLHPVAVRAAAAIGLIHKPPRDPPGQCPGGGQQEYGRKHHPGRDAIESRIDASNDPVQHGVAEKKSIAPQAE